LYRRERWGGAGGAEVQEVVTGVSGPLGWKMAGWMRTLRRR